MILQPTLVLLHGPGAQRLKEQLVRWFDVDERKAFYFAEIEDDEDLEMAIPAAVSQLRSARLLSELICCGYVPKNYRLQEFRTLIISMSQDQDWISRARKAVADSLETAPFLNRIFWIMLLESQRLDRLEGAQQRLLADFGGNESVTLFHVFPLWRGSNLEPEDTSAILERLAILLLKADAEAAFPVVSKLALNKSAWTVGIEAYRLRGHSEAGKCALFLAARELIAQCFTGQAMSAATLAKLVREKIPDFDKQADMDPFTPEGLELVGKYVRHYVPDLLDALASHSPNVESWLDCLKQLKRETARPKKDLKLSLRNGMIEAAGGKGRPQYSALSVFVMTISAAACYLLAKPPAEHLELAAPSKEEFAMQLPRHPIFSAALEQILADIQPLQSPELLQEPQLAPAYESSLPTDHVEFAKVDRELIDAARDLLVQRTFALPSLLPFEFIDGEMTPASAMAQVLSAQNEMEGKLESIIISRWLKQVREARNQNGNSADSTWLDFMFSSATPNPIHLECEISNRENGPQQPGWFPPFWLHYLHAVAMN